jgi:hypothetical protein
LPRPCALVGDGVGDVTFGVDVDRACVGVRRTVAAAVDPPLGAAVAVMM